MSDLDPFWIALRTFIMSLSEPSFEKSGVSPAPAALMSQQGDVMRIDTQRISGVAEKKRGEWVDHMRRISVDRDQAAFAELFEHFAPRVKAFLMKSGASDALAEDCAQDVMVTLWNKAEMFDPSRASVATWIFTIARNRRIDALRKERRPEPEELPWGPTAEPEQADVLGLQQESAILSEAIRKLPEKQRELIEKAYFGDLTHSEIAAATGLPLGTIKSRIRLALDRLRHAMR